MLATLPFSLNFFHPLTEWSLLAVGGWALYLGIKAKKTRTGTPEQRKQLVSGKFAQRHYRWGALFLAVMTLGTLGGMAVTYLNNGKLFMGPHLLVGLAMTGMIAVAASLAPLMQQGNLIARKAHVGLNMGVLTLFLWQAVSGMEIVNKIWSNR
ncbi:DUF4079 domain-containing protein [Synechococcus sp. CC9616]|jgi:MFS family permease|uniref:DUF4079 domain-containing protein n=1 Tax=Synechococcus sp. CC9616 TaxID=110663 RepID=UPI00048E2980|nr:DUF4079 domain-containing protein [Synechococcus sp. CC9616]|tara:strand:- start:93 stop:551 length:459 start_codon:yes stop_codon:yes gene_type:complete